MTRSGSYTTTIAAVLLASCASGPPAAPGPDDRQAINDPGALEILEAGARTRATSEYDEAAREARVAMFDGPRLLHRSADRAELAALPRTGIVDRTVSVPFTFGSARFAPTPSQAFRIRELFARADRIEVRGRTDGVGPRDGDETVARLRAEAAKRYLIDRGVPARIISVGYVAGGDYVADNARHTGRRQNRRVDLEFILGDEFQPGDDDIASWQQVPGS